MYTNNPIKPCETWTTTIKEDPALGTYIELPPELLEALGWTEGTQVQWSETEVCGDTGEHQGLILEKVSDAAKHLGAEEGTRTVK
jgi:hypothetical protein